MNLFYLIPIILLLFVILIFTVALRIKFILDTNSANINLSIKWLYPVLQIIITTKEDKPILTVYFLTMKIYYKELKVKKQKSNVSLIRSVKPSNIKVDAFYGFKDPFTTGIACGAISIVSQYTNIKQHPNFLSIKDYIYLDATAKVNIGSTLVNMTKQKINSF